MINTLPTWEDITFFLKTQIILLGQLLGLPRIIFPLRSYDISGFSGFSPCISGSDTVPQNPIAYPLVIKRGWPVKSTTCFDDFPAIKLQ